MIPLWPVVKWVLLADAGAVLGVIGLRGWLRRRAARQWLEAIRDSERKAWRQQKDRHR